MLDPATGEMSPRAEALLYAADKAQHIYAVVQPALRRGAVVVCDRYVDSMLAYQGAGRVLALDEVEQVARWATGDLRPHLTVVLDTELAEAVHAKADLDRLEAAGEVFHERARQFFLELAAREPEHYLVLDARASRDEIAEARGAGERLLAGAEQGGGVLARCADDESTLPISLPGRRAVEGRTAAVGSGRQNRGMTTEVTQTEVTQGVWAELIGQDQAVATLRRAVAGEPHAMSHAWLVTGPPGSGRSNAARAFAAGLECARGFGCGECNECRTSLSGAHPDVTLVRTELLSIGVDEVRELVRRAVMSPTLGRWQVIVVEDADRVTERGADALLKSIEEPAPRTVWILCAPNPDDVVATIRSRCRLLRLQTPSVAAVAELLRTRDGIEPPTWRRTRRGSPKVTSAGPERWPATRKLGTGAPRCCGFRRS